jgi:hypothetical protein
MANPGDLTARAVAAAVALAAEHGLRTTEPAVLAARSNVLVHLRPAPVVARVGSTTALLRPDVRSWFEREIALAGFLAGRGAAVVPPADELPPGPHERDGLPITFWRHVEPGPDRQPAAEEAGRALRDLHEALREFPGGAGELPRLVCHQVEVPRLLDSLEGALAADDLARLRDVHQRLAETLLDSRRPVQALHGDAHVGNLLAAPGRLLWNDFEDTGSGPVEWDLACFCWTPPWGRKAALAAYGPEAPSLKELAPWLEARELQGTVWLAAKARFFPESRARAEELLARWR